MWHEVEDLAVERERLLARALPSPQTPVLCALDIVPSVAPSDYARHIKDVLAPVLNIAATASFGDEGVPTTGIPEWFAYSCGEHPSSDVQFARAGRESYLRVDGTDGPWSLQDWLFRFEPGDYSIRGWAYWDLTHTTDGILRLWIDNWGETHFSHLDLLWLAHLCGAQQVSSPELYRSGEWLAEPSLLA